MITRRTAASLVLAAGTASSLVALGGNASARPAAGCSSARQCLVSLADNATLVARRGAALDASLDLDRQAGVSLETLTGRRLWRVHVTSSSQPPQVAAAGDVDGDGFNDFILWTANPLAPAQKCGQTGMRSSGLLLVNGRTGSASSPFPALTDICWDTPTFNYPTQQWDFGSVYIGDYEPALRGNEVVLIPYYATEGTVWNFAAARRWQVVRSGGAASFPWPSTATFDRIYDASNPTPCSHPLPGGPCFVQYSHVANAVFLPAPSRGFFTLTSSRALIYRPNLTPTSDLTWFAGSMTDNAGRNYGLLETYRDHGTTYADLIGGCSVNTMWTAMQPGASSTGGDDNCGLVHQLQRFSFSGLSITRRAERYYGYFGTTGALEGRVEYPAHPRAALGGAGTSWTVLNVLHGGTWSVEVFRAPMSTEPLVLRGWFAWDTVRIGSRAELLATRTGNRTVAPAQFDVLRWSRNEFRSVQHVAGAVPALVRTPQTTALHSLENALFSSVVRDVNGDGRPDVLAATPRGTRRLVALSAAAPR